MTGFRPGNLVWILCLAVVLTPVAGRGEAPAPSVEPVLPESAASARPSWGRRILWYVPNRALDLLDIFRARVRLGPGLALNVRLTDYGAFYAGKYDAVYLGLPGPRYPRRLRPPAGLESLHGIVLAGVDATDDTRHGPEYGAAESDLGVQVLLVGAEAGIDAMEIADFLGGLVFLDPRNDDFPRAARDLPDTTSAVSLGEGTGAFAVEPKPAAFDSIGARLDYLDENVQRRISEPLRATDAHFAVDPDAPLIAPQTQIRLGLYTSFRQGDGFEFELSPDMELDVELPNLEQKLRLFVESARENALPQNEIIEQDEKGINVGARTFYEKLNLSFDAGVRARWVPVAFARVSWKRAWGLGRLDITPELRGFVQTDTGVGALASLYLNCWLGGSNNGLLLQSSSAKWTHDKDTLEWGASLALGRVPVLLDETQRGRHIQWRDTARAQGLRYAVFGSHGNVDRHRLCFRFCGPLYKQWIYWEIDPALEWSREEDYDTAVVLLAGIDMLFWGRYSE